MDSTVYTTITHGHGDLAAQAEHRRRVARMVKAANRSRCVRGCADTSLCTHGLDDSGLI